MVRGKLHDWNLGRLVDDAELIIGELVANAADTGCHLLMVVKIRRITALTVRLKADAPTP